MYPKEIKSTKDRLDYAVAMGKKIKEEEEKKKKDTLYQQAYKELSQPKQTIQPTKDEYQQAYNEVFMEYSNPEKTRRDYIPTLNTVSNKQVNNVGDALSHLGQKAIYGLAGGMSNIAGGVAKTLGNPGTAIDVVLDIPESMHNSFLKNTYKIMDKENPGYYNVLSEKDKIKHDSLFNQTKTENFLDRNIDQYDDFMNWLDNNPVSNVLDNVGDGYLNSNNYFRSNYNEEDMNKILIFGGDIVQGATNMIPSITVGAVTGNPSLAMGTMGVNAYGGGLHQALMEGADLENAYRYGLANALTEVATESLVGGIPALGGGYADNLITKVTDKAFKTPTAKNIANKGLDLLGEGLEEYLGDVIGEFTTDIYSNEKQYEDPMQRLKDAQADALYSGLVGIGTAGLLNAPGYISEVNANRQNNASTDTIQSNILENNTLAKEPVNSEIKQAVTELEEEFNQPKQYELTQEQLDNSPFSLEELQSDGSEIIITKNELLNDNALIKDNAQKVNTQNIEIQLENSNYDKQTVATLSKLSNEYGIPLKFEELPSHINGMYYNGEIVINKNSSDPLVTVFTHELTHSLESTQTYNELVESVINHLNTTSLISDLNAVIDEEVYRVIQERAELGINLNYDQAHKEVIAEYISEYIADDSFINSISSNKSIVQRIVDWLKNIVTSLTGSKEQKAYKDLLNKYQKALTQVNYQPVNINELNAGTPFSITPIQNKELSNTKTTETENILKEVRNQYKITTNANEAGYIDLDGKMIDFSGKQEGGASNVRYMDHSDLYLDDSDVDYKKYIDMGNIRTFPETGGFELIYKPNKEQVNALLKYLKTNTVAKNEGSFVGISSPNKIGYYDIANLEFSNNKTANEILNEVMSYFDNESMDLNQAKYSVNKDNLRKDGSRKDLMAIHNLSASKLLNANELGGFPMPSLAVTKDSISHDGYGDISLIFNKDTINPSNRDNKIYNRDAWTPTFPSVNYNVNDTYSIRKVFDNKINNSNYIKQYAEGYDIQKIITRLYEENIGDILKNSEGNLNKLTENFSDIDSLKLLYAEEKGIKLDPIYKETQPNFDVWKEIVDLYGGAENLENNINNRDYLKTKINELSKIVGKDLLTEQFRIKLYVKTALDSVKEGNQTVLDKSAVINELSKKIDNQDYKNWINDNITNKITYKKGIRNNKDPFTYSGKRRSFNELHSPVTLNNVVTNMKAQKQNDSIIGVNNLLGNLASEFNSIQDVIDSRDTLAKRDNVYKDSMNRYHDQMINLANEVISYNPILDEGFNGISNVIDTVGYHLTKATTAKQLQTKVNKDVGWKLALGTAERFIQFKNDLNKQPSSYFEAKPKRAVTFDEINTAVIPKNSSADVINMLENKGINYVTYDPNIEGDRNRVINTIEDAKFSPKKEIRNNIITLNKEIPGLREKITNTTNILMQDDDAGLRKLLQQTAKEIIDNGEVSPNTYQIIIDYVTENAGVQDPSFKRSELVKYLRSVSPISVKPRSFANGENLFSANQDLPYGVNFTTNPGPDDQGLDSIWGEMQGMFPGVFDDDGSIAGDSTTSFTTEEDMIGRVFDVLNTRGKKLYYFKDEYGYDTFKDMVTQSLNEYLADIKVSMKHKDTVMKKSNLKQTKNILKDNVITDSINGIASKAYESDIKPAIEAGDYIDPKEYKKKPISKMNEKANSPSVQEDILNIVIGGLDKGALSKSIEQNGDAIADGKQDIKKSWSNVITNPLFEAKANYAKEVSTRLDDVYNTIVKGLKIKKGSKESSAVMWYGEGQRIKPGSSKIELESYTELDLKNDFPNNYQEIISASKYIRNMYDEYITRINESLELIYPTQKLEKALNERKSKLTKEIELKKEELMKAIADNSDTDTLTSIQKSIKRLSNEYNNSKEYIYRNRRLEPRKDYFMHFQEISMADSLKDLFSLEGPSNISNQLAGKSEFTKPLSKWEGFMQRRGMGRYAEDAVGGLISYIPKAEYKINIDPYTSYMRGVIKNVVDISDDNQVSNTKMITYLSNFANDLAGKTNPLDRWISNTENGRWIVQKLKKLSSRAKGNAVMGNMNSAVSQFFNMPNAVALLKKQGGMKASVDVTKGTQLYFVDKTMNNEIIKQSPFMMERYMDSKISQFDEGILSDAKNFAAFILTFGDEVVAKETWYSAYSQGLRLKVSDPIMYADKLTRGAIAGRGIGETALSQKSAVVGLLAPFQVEVNNAWQLMKSLSGGKEKDLSALMLMFLTTWLMNNLNEKITGNRVGLDAIDALNDVVNNDAGIGRLLGEVLSNVPGGTQLSLFLFNNDSKREKFFGEADPSRYGTGNIGLNAITDPALDLFNGENVDLIKIFTQLGVPFGGKQIERTLKYGQDTGVLPRFKFNKDDLFKYENPFDGAVSDTGRIRYIIDKDDILNNMKGLLFGSYATNEGKEYLEKGYKPLGPKQTELYKEFEKLGESGNDIVQYIRDINKVDSIKDEYGNTIKNTKALQIRDMWEDAGLYDEVEKIIENTEFKPGDFGLNKTVFELTDKDFKEMFEELIK